ncbi:hypothetical protein [Enterovibrio calviensis]|uniref:hypothetical protein n=1 Tax=Enterovibrio calviensis TaxID=91359 RepID=UPI001FE184D0|nr:hypothetical protein [Enterovibrio calviensis]
MRSSTCSDADFGVSDEGVVADSALAKAGKEKTRKEAKKTTDKKDQGVRKLIATAPSAQMNNIYLNNLKMASLGCLDIEVWHFV